MPFLKVLKPPNMVAVIKDRIEKVEGSPAHIIRKEIIIKPKERIVVITNGVLNQKS